MADIITEEQQELTTLLERKLKKLPQKFLPAITLTDIMNRTPVTRLFNIPSDLQLEYFLAIRTRLAQYNDLAIKSYEDQSLNLTRAIWFYRLDERHQFQRFHDSIRFNLALFVTLLTRHERDPGFEFPGRDFVVAYLQAVYENHNEATQFDKRETFIRLWKKEEFDFFTFKTSQRTRMRNQCKRLRASWETELDLARNKMGDQRYEQIVAPLVGVFIPGRKDQERSAVRTLIPTVEAVSGLKDEEGKEDSARENTLLKALEVPFPEVEDPSGMADGLRDYGKGFKEVARLWDSIRDMYNIQPREILKVLTDLFTPMPAYEEEK